ncbi:hypothetical protein PPACK8108_LOCUS2746 [Phakopsora pachyrhizi]|uniref:Succinate dehydrogenase cytochrome b560 subunit n=1 Tax=Phakopsora pachyrhizi TaxID=170000 RepID=A0A0S1MIT9_PHAPC|nr:hypothetical protein PPACK8108_LOCUS2746 [Phakopsora pachyrhizi]
MMASTIAGSFSHLRPGIGLAFRSVRLQTSAIGSLKVSVQQNRFSSSKATYTSSEDAAKLLNEQRKLRPSSPHFTIYQPQLTWYSSIFNRVTGCALTGGLYAFSLGYLTLPAVGIPMDSETLVQLAASAPAWSKVATKTVLAVPFTYHTFNGIRHLAWDMGYVIDLKSSYTAGYVVIGLTAVSSVGLALL